MHVPVTASLLVAALVFAAQANAQVVRIVDRQNRPGTHFLDLPAAVAASAPGDVLRVRYTDPLVLPYTAPTITHALTVIGDGLQPGLVGNFVVQNLPAGHRVVLRDLQLAPFVGANPQFSNCALSLLGNAGTVHLQNVDRGTLATSASGLNPWRIDGCRLVTLAHCSFDMVGPTGTLLIKDSALVTLHASMLLHAAVTTAPTLSVVNSQVVLSDTIVVGSGQATGAVAIDVAGADVRLAGSGTSVVSTTGGTAIRSAAGGGSVAVGSSAFVGPVIGVPLVQQPVAALGGRIDANNLLTLSMFGESLGIGVLAVGEPIPAPIPLFGGSLYLDPVLSGTLDLVAFTFGGRGSWQLQLTAPLPAGFTAWLQGVSLGVGSGFLLTPPLVVTGP